MNFFKKNKAIFIIMLIVLVVLAITGFALFKFLFSGINDSKYGNRLDGIENVAISEELTNKSKETLKGIEGVTNVTYSLSGKICNFIITVNKDVKPDSVKKIVPEILKEYSEEQKKFYDFQVFINSSEESELYPIIGYKNIQNETFSWTGKVVKDEK